jgi:hypothetical protein
MDTKSFDAVARFLADRKFTRRETLKQAGTGIAAGAVAAAGISTLSAAPKAAAATQSATPVAMADVKPLNTSMLFVQSFQAGSVAPVDGDATKFTVSLESGLGQTIYFSDRPNRIVGAMPTGEFIDTLGFTADNPPNAAILMEGEDGATHFAVVELFNPVYDDSAANLTYDVSVLEEWNKTIDTQFTSAETQLSAASFGAAHLLIDGIADCPDAEMSCRRGSETVGTLDGHAGHCYSWSNFACFPCDPWGATPATFDDMCNTQFADACGGECYSWNFCSSDAPFGNTYCQNSDAASNFGS